MSLYINFEPHSYYKGFAIKKVYTDLGKKVGYEAYTDNGNTYRIDMLDAFTLKRLKKQITEYRSK